MRCMCLFLRRCLGEMHKGELYLVEGSRALLMFGGRGQMILSLPVPRGGFRSRFRSPNFCLCILTRKTMGVWSQNHDERGVVVLFYHCLMRDFTYGCWFSLSLVYPFGQLDRCCEANCWTNGSPRFQSPLQRSQSEISPQQIPEPKMEKKTGTHTELYRQLSTKWKSTLRCFCIYR